MLQKATLYLLLLFSFTLLGCIDSIKKEQWVETTGKITESSSIPDGSYAYTLTYVVTGGNAHNIEGKLRQGPLSQHYFGQTKKAKEGQLLKLRYSKEDPMHHQLLDDIQFN